MDLTCSCNAIVVVFFLSDINLSVFFPLNPVIYRIGNVPNILHPRCKEQDDKMNLTATELGSKDTFLGPGTRF